MSARYPVTATPTANGLVPPTDSPADSGKVLSQTGWVSTGGGSPHALGSHTDTVLTSPADGHVLTYDSGTGKWVNEAPAGGGSGTVTSVGLAVPTDIFSVSGSPVTASGTLTVAKVNQSANLVYAGPTGGAAAAPAFRALVTADLPSISDNLISFSTVRVANTVHAGPTTGADAPPTWRALVAADIPTASDTAQGAVELATVAEADTGTDTARAVTPAGVNGRLPKSAFTANGVILYGTGSGTYTQLTAGTNGHVLTLASGVPTWAAAAGGGSSVTRLRMTSDLTTSSTTLSAITGLSTFTLSASTVYRFRAVLFVTTNAATVGIHFGVNFTGTVTHVRVGHEANPAAAVAVAGSAVGNAAATAVNTKILATTGGPGTSPAMVVLEGIIEVGASGGTFSFQFASETATVTTVQRGSYAEVEAIS